MAIRRAPLANFISTTLNGSVDDAVTTITLNSATNLQAPGAIVIDRIDSSGTSTPSKREVVEYTGISGNDLTGCIRAADNSTARSHSDGAIVETNVTVGTFNSLVSAVELVADSNGYLRPLASPASLAILQNTTFLTTSIASIAALHIQRRIDVSSASITGIGLYPVFHSSGSFSGATVAVGGLLSTPRTATFNWVSVVTRTVASGASVLFDFMKNGTSVFAGSTKPTIVGGGTFVSTASLSTKNFNPGSLIRADIATLPGGGHITDITIQAGE